MQIEINNGQVLDVSIEDGKLIFRTMEKGVCTRADSFIDGELVTLYNWAIYQRDNNNFELNF